MFQVALVQLKHPRVALVVVHLQLAESALHDEGFLLYRVDVQGRLKVRIQRKKFAAILSLVAHPLFLAPDFGHFVDEARVHAFAITL